MYVVRVRVVLCVRELIFLSGNFFSFVRAPRCRVRGFPTIFVEEILLVDELRAADWFSLRVI